MKKKIQIVLFAVAASFFYVSAQPYRALVLMNTDIFANPYEGYMLDSLVANVDGLIIDSIIPQDTFRDDPVFQTEVGYQDYDLFIIMESISSARCENFGTAGFPLPCLSLEPYAPQRTTWFSAPNFNLVASSNDSCQKFVVRAPAHEIMTGIAAEGEEVIWTTDFNDGQQYGGQVHVAFLNELAGGYYDDVASNATNVAYAKQLYDSGYTNNAWLWAIEGEAGATLENRMVVISNHYAFDQYATEAFYDVICNSAKWLLHIPIGTPPGPNLKLSDLLVNGVTIEGFNPYIKTYTYILPYGSSTIPTVTCATQDPLATYNINEGSQINDTTIITVFSPDSTSTDLYYVIFNMASISTVATLDDIKVDNKTISGFDPNIFNYTAVMPYGTENNDVPDITFTLTNESAHAFMDTAKTIEDSTLITVTSEDLQSTNTYKILFEVAEASNDATLKDLQVENETLSDFSRKKYSYVYYVPTGTIEIQKVSATKNHPGASVNIIQSPVVLGTAYVEVTAEDKTTDKTYYINFLDESTDIIKSNSGSLQIYPTIVNNVLNINLPSECETANASVFSITGEKILGQNINRSSNLIDCSALSSGIYFIKIENDKLKYTGKFIKE
ncbi:MAG: T9SS type A sorting domain-containing protein [Bacteroidales bacterium]|nr:T9SS type A sorting domain-containing protein [Bacteroidales bacterium]